MKIKLHQDDLPSDTNLGTTIAIDTETMGLNPLRDKLCLVQLSSGNNICHLVKINNLKNKPTNLIKILKNNKILKIFHFARFDIAILKHTYGINIKNVYCTKIASKLARTYTDKHGLKDLCKELLNIELSKVEQTSDWSVEELTEEQKVYAASDVLHLHKLKEILEEKLKKLNRKDLAENCFQFISTRAYLDLNGWSEIDIFKH